MAHFKALGRFGAQWLGLAVQSGHRPDNRLFLRAAYRTFFKREPDREGVAYYLNALAENRISHVNVVGAFLKSDEYLQVHGLKIHPLDALHEARVSLVRTCLPPAQRIVDLGGAADNDRPEGALLAMGYPHRPCHITIVDLPPEHRLRKEDGAEQATGLTLGDGAEVEYLYQSMAAALEIADASVDLVWSGESIEHVAEAEADLICREAYRVLRPGGHFCLDTPNAALTRIEAPDHFTHPEHQREYQVGELRAKLEAAGFQVVDARGICAMPRSLQNQRFEQREMVENRGLHDDPETGYLFYLAAHKPV